MGASLRPLLIPERNDVDVAAVAADEVIAEKEYIVAFGSVPRERMRSLY